MPRETHVARIVNDIQARIASGEWRPGHKLPSINEMKTIYECSEQPVKRAQDILKALSYVVSEHGRGVFVAEQPPAAGDDATSAGGGTSPTDRSH